MNLRALFSISHSPLPTALYSALCWLYINSLPYHVLGPGSFLVLFLLSFMLGCFLIVLQTKTVSDHEGPIVMLSGDVIPAAPERPQQRENERHIQKWVIPTRRIFFFLSIFLIVFWITLSLHGLPKEWLDYGYATLIYIFSHIEQSDSSITSIRDPDNSTYSVQPVSLALPYALFIFWGLHGHKYGDE